MNRTPQFRLSPSSTISRTLAAAVALAAGTFAGCATERAGFRPTTMVSTTEAGFPAARYAVPPNAPRGEVFVTSFGTRQVDETSDARSDLVHVRVAVANQTGTGTWTFAPSRQLLVAQGAAPQGPEFLEIDGRNPGDDRIAPAQRKVFDLYYRMPKGASHDAIVPGFDLTWQLEADGQSVSERTSFVREPYRDYGEATRSYWATGVVSPWWVSWYGPPWLGWYGPWWAGPYWGGYWGYGYRAYPYGYGWGPRVGVGVGIGGGYGYRGYHGGWGGGIRGGGGGTVRAAPVRGGRSR
jgi:hypothetical protein